MKKLIVFDLDGTLAPSKASIDSEMAGLLRDLLRVAKVAIISGGDWIQFDKQVLQHLPKDSKLEELSILPTCGTKFYQYSGDWKKLYSLDLSKDQKSKILASLDTAMKESGQSKPTKTWGQIIEDRGSQITFSALGQEAPLEAKAAWDPDFAKRKKMKAILDKLIPEFSVRLGGTTSIDITEPGVDKGFGIQKLTETLGIPIDEMVFAGDALFPGGNDYPAEQAGVVSISVRNPEDTKIVIRTIIACLANCTD